MNIKLICKSAFCYASMATMALLVSSCGNDFLQVTDPVNVEAKIFYSNQAEAEAGLYGIYSAYQTSNLCGFQLAHMDQLTDNMSNNTNTDGFRSFVSGTQNASNARVVEFYRHCYNVVNRANYVIDRVGKMTTAQIEEVNRKRILAEASFLRDYAYFMLAELYSDVPLYTTPQDGTTNGMASTLKADIQAFLEKDLTTIIPDLPVTITASEKGRIGRGAAVTLLGQLYLYKKEYDKAAATLEPLMSAPYKYGLVSNYASLFVPAGEFSKESVFEINFDGSEVDPNGESSFSTTIDTAAAPLKPFTNLTPSNNLVDSYLCTDGKPIADNINLYGTKSPLYNSSGASRFANRDPRLRATIFTSADVTPGGNKVWSWTSNTSFAKKKFVEVTNIVYSKGQQNYYLYRYADVLLMYAEAKNEAAGEAVTEVYTAVNKVRSRVGMPNYPAGLTQDQMRQYIRDERRWEFALEHQRYFDLRRWGMLEQMLEGEKDKDGNYVRKFIGAVIVPQPKDYVWPLPQVEIDNNTAITQHPLWK